MVKVLILLSVIILVCVLLNNASEKIGMPVLLAFIVFGILAGTFYGDRSQALTYFQDQQLAEQVCTAALIFIMFYGGFGTKWKSAKCVAVESGLLASAGVCLTAGLTGLFCHFVLGWQWIESFLMGSVVSSTDAASVFSILRSRNLALKNNTGPILELESGSNDPCSYMLTIIMVSLMKGQMEGGQIVWMVIAQIGLGAILGIVIAQLAVFAMRHIQFPTSGFDSLFVLSIAMAAYAIPSVLGGNGYLSAYIVGIIMGNNSFPGRRKLIAFFDGLTGLMQVVIFFILGLLARPDSLHHSVLPALAIFAAMLIIVRPATIAAVLTPFKKYGFRQQCFISFVGLRGAASIVFAIMATVGNSHLDNDIFNIVFCIVLLSIALQGSLIPLAAKKLRMIDESPDAIKSFNDISDETDMHFSRIDITEDNIWCGKAIKELQIPRTVLICRVVKEVDGQKQRLVPNGNTMIESGDIVIVCTRAYRSDKELHIIEQEISLDRLKWAGAAVKDYPFEPNEQLVLLVRGEQSIIPNGSTVLEAGDLLFINKG